MQRQRQVHPHSSLGELSIEGNQLLQLVDERYNATFLCLHAPASITNCTYEAVNMQPPTADAAAGVERSDTLKVRHLEERTCMLNKAAMPCTMSHFVLLKQLAMQNKAEGMGANLEGQPHVPGTSIWLQLSLLQRHVCSPQQSRVPKGFGIQDLDPVQSALADRTQPLKSCTNAQHHGHSMLHQNQKCLMRFHCRIV